ncbi:MAG: 2-dehydropantoate 2-reductase [Acidobacteriaceae bacterium]|nr:2-dehydropantoate 2-reductase [Acidobacteriaceae bacterium]
MRIAIVGSGGVGGYFGARLAQAGAHVSFLARGAHLAAMRARGLTIESPDGDLHVPEVNATDDPASIGAVDLVFFTVKLYDTEEALTLLPPLLGPDTLVVPFQNGVDTVDRLIAAIGRNHVAGGTAYISAVVAEPGVIRHTARHRLIFGPLHGDAPASLNALDALCRAAGFEGVLSERILVEIWSKFAHLSVFSGMTALTRSPIGVIRRDPELLAMFETALHESIAVARAKQIPLAHNIFERVMASVDTLPPHMKSSMLEDLERGRRIELPWLSGAVVRIGQEVGVPTPVHQLIVRLLRPHLNGNAGAIRSPGAVE